MAMEAYFINRRLYPESRHLAFYVMAVGVRVVASRALHLAELVELNLPISLELLHRADGKVVVTIADSGSGMPESVRHQIFDPGFTTKGVGVGTGLGLSITYRIIKRHKGEIDVSSAVGGGTVVTVTLPTDLAGAA